VATVAIKPGNTDIQLTARAKANTIPKPFRSVPGGLYPMMSAAFEVDEYRIKAGWPSPVPDCDVRINVLVSADGDSLGNRDAPTSLVTGAPLRWVADSDYYDQTALQWTPIQGNVSPWETSPDHAPTLISDYEYTIGDERFTDMTALNFDSNTADYMWNNLDLVMGGTKGYTVIMVLNPNSIYGNDPNIIENGLWGPDDTSGIWAAFTVTNQAIYLTTESKPAQKGPSIGDALSDNTPTYVALVVGRPQTSIYAASGPSSVRVKSLASGATPESLNTRFWLGNSPSDAAGTMDMALLDLNIYPELLSKTDVLAEFSLLSGVYGGDQ